MLSSVFVDRPRLAIVIAIVTTIAGALALYSIPIAQYPDIVPPQVSVTTNFPGASAACLKTFGVRASPSKRSHRRCLV
jgi:multidrug efflux pump subunit AcrB